MARFSFIDFRAILNFSFWLTKYIQSFTIFTSFKKIQMMKKKQII